MTLAVACAAVLVTLTAMLMVAIAGIAGGGLESFAGQAPTASELVMESATERALVSPATAVLAGK